MKNIRKFQVGDETILSEIVRRGLFEINIKDYSQEALDPLAAMYSPSYILAEAQNLHMYVYEENGIPLGTCSIGRPSETEGYIQTFFINPDRVGEGIGTALLAAIEADPWFKETDIVRVHSSISARTFYELHGYLHETGTPVCIDEDHYNMYKK